MAAAEHAAKLQAELDAQRQAETEAARVAAAEHAAKLQAELDAQRQAEAEVPPVMFKYSTPIYTRNSCFIEFS